MTSIGIFYGSSTGNTEAAAMAIAAGLRAVPGVTVEVIEISRKTVEKLTHFPKLILGIPTWDIGELQEDWDRVMPEIEGMNFTGQQVALFGCGDQYGYPDTYQDADCILVGVERGAELVGYWPTDGYDFEESLAVEGDMFLGLALDDNQKKLTPSRIKAWVQQLIDEFQLTAEAVAGS
jgi:flavodoxin I